MTWGLDDFPVSECVIGMNEGLRAPSAVEEMWRDDIRWKEERNGRQWTRAFFRGSLLKVDGTYLCLGEHGALATMNLSPKGVKVLQREQLFLAPEAWTLPTLHRGLLYVCQNEPGLTGDTTRRLLCYDLRAGK